MTAPWLVWADRMAAAAELTRSGDQRSTVPKGDAQAFVAAAVAAATLLSQARKQLCMRATQAVSDLGWHSIARQVESALAGLMQRGRLPSPDGFSDPSWDARS